MGLWLCQKSARTSPGPPRPQGSFSCAALIRGGNHGEENWASAERDAGRRSGAVSGKRGPGRPGRRAEAVQGADGQQPAAGHHQRHGRQSLVHRGRRKRQLPRISRASPRAALSPSSPPTATTCSLYRHRPGPGRHPLHDVQRPGAGALRRGPAEPSLPPIDIPDTNSASQLDVDGDDVWFIDNFSSLRRYNITTEEFTAFPLEFDKSAADVVVDSAGDVWFTAPLDNTVNRLDPVTGPSSSRSPSRTGSARGRSPSPPTGRSGSPPGSCRRASAASTRPPST